MSTERSKSERKWIPVGLAIGAGVGVATDAIAIGVGLGLVFGILVGRLRARKSR